LKSDDPKANNLFKENIDALRELPHSTQERTQLEIELDEAINDTHHESDGEEFKEQYFSNDSKKRQSR
jgi:hypothetical protein